MNRDAPLTAAQRAVLHIVHRAQEDCDFAAVMRDTESLRLCLRAVAKHRGESIEETRHRVNSAIRNNPGESEVDRLTRRLAQADKNLAELREQKTKRQTEEDAATGQSALNIEPSTHSAIPPASTDPVEQLLLEFQRIHDYNPRDLRAAHTAYIIDISLASSVALTREQMIEETRNWLAKFGSDISSGRIVLHAPKARNGFSRKQQRKKGGGRKQLTGPSKLRTAREREAVAAKLKESRRRKAG